MYQTKINACEKVDLDLTSIVTRLEDHTIITQFYLLIKILSN